MKAIKYPKIGQFRNVVKQVSEMATFGGIDENGNVIRNRDAKLPTLKFKGTTKLHGTNASVIFDDVDGYRPQSRERVLTIKNDNFGFAAFAEKNKVVFMHFIKHIRQKHQIDLTQNSICIYGEWAGQGIQKGVAISKLPKRFYIFGIRIKPIVTETFNDSNQEEQQHPSLWLDCDGISSHDNGIYNINEFPCWELNIDFSHPQAVQNTLVEITDGVEKCCPVSSQFMDEHGNTIEGVGEGVVWTSEYKGQTLRMKIKGEKHSASKVKTVAKVDPEKMKSTEEFVDMTVTENRVRQAIQSVDGCDGTNKYLGQIIKWVHKDIIDEETDTLVASGLIWKDVASRVTLKIKDIYMNLPL